jgi:penicillin-binding protein 1C
MKLIKKIILYILLLISLFFLLNYLYPLNTARLSKPKSILIYDRDNHLLSVKLSSDGFLRIPIKQKELNKNIQQIVLGYEDQYFEHHFGVNPLAIVRALWFNLTNQRKIGASTITMQVARMMHHKQRTLSQKLIEIFNALQLELYYSKEEILRFYLNNAPYGGNVEGFASASFRYFNIATSSLSLSQIAYLSAIPKNPNANRPKKLRDINKIKNRLIKRLLDLGLLTHINYQQALEEKITVNIQALPHQIPHLSAQITQEGEVHTTIDAVLQHKVEKILESEIENVKKFKVYNASAIVIDNQSMEIVAYVGSNNFYDNLHGGQNNGLLALHSPGSTLKPLIYAKALEEGLITPLKKLYDVPLFIEGYKPKNYSKEYLGEITASEALQLSLNIPAVELDRLLKEKSLYSLLKQANISSLIHKKSYYGSSLTLGGFGLSLIENAQLFAMLANKGIYQQASFIKSINYKKSKILKAESSYLVSNILADAPRLSFSSSWEHMKDVKKIAFKTGTSAHSKDMLTIGYTPKYTVAVWYGNFSGKASKAYQGVYPTGLRVASPTMFKIFKELKKASWFSKPKGIINKRICQDAIQINKCKKSIQDELIEDIILQNSCSSMRAEVLSYLLKQQTIRSIKELSKHKCYQEWKEYKPLITNPVHNKTYIHNKLLPNEMKKTMLNCYSFEQNSTIYWLIDNNTPIIGISGIPIYQYLSPKKHEISCLDEGAKLKSIVIFNEEL